MRFKLLIIKKILFFILLVNTALLYAEEIPNIWDVLRDEFSLNHEVYRVEVQEQIKWLAAHPGYLKSVCLEAKPYIYHVLTQIKKYKLPGELALLPMLESAYNPFAYSRVGAAGLWQLMPRTAQGLGVKQDWWFDGRRGIDSSTDAALKYLLYLKKVFNGNWLLAIASYDAGEGTIGRAVKANTPLGQPVNFWNLIIPRETKIYVPRLLALAEIIKNPEHYHIVLPNIAYLPYFTKVYIGSQIDLNRAAKLADISYKELIKLNPGFNHWTTAPYAPFTLLIPVAKAAVFTINFAHFPQEKRVSWIQHQVRPEDNLDTIATRYHTTVSLIKQLNQLPSYSTTLPASLLIPSTKNTAIVLKNNLAPLKPIRLFSPVNKDHKIIHIVQANDNLQTIQNMYKVSLEEIKRWNNLMQPIRYRQQLIIWKKIKQPTSYLVRAGDSLNNIAKFHHTTVSTLLSLNPELNKDPPLLAGKKILIG